MSIVTNAHIRRLSLGAMIAACASAFAVSAAFAQTARRPAASPVAATTVTGSQSFQKSNDWTVGVAGGLLEGTFIRFAAELAKVLDDGPNLRVIPMVTFGAVGNVEDLLFLKGVDIAITQADVLEHFKKEDKSGNIDKRINYIMRFFQTEAHIYARPEIKRIEDLAGKKVNFNVPGTAGVLTGGIIFDRLGVVPEKVFLNQAIALEKMRTGEISAIVHLVGKPNDLFAKFKPEPGFHFLPIEYSDKFADFYVPTEITSEDYPNLMAPGEKVQSIGVATVLAVYNWPKGSDRHRRVQRFIEHLFARFDRFQQPPFQPKWKEMNLAATVPGWNRYPTAEELLAKYLPETPPERSP